MSTVETPRVEHPPSETADLSASPAPVWTAQDEQVRAIARRIRNHLAVVRRCSQQRDGEFLDRLTPQYAVLGLELEQLAALVEQVEKLSRDHAGYARTRAQT